MSHDHLVSLTGLLAVHLTPVDLEAPDKIRGALYHYNPVETCVDAVATYAAAIGRDPRLYYARYCWQVYVFTTRSHRRITGPGL
jgi:hypothetical protein